jgi:hypothetical protein
MPTFCPSCGFNNPNGMRFCGNCGSKLPAEELIAGPKVTAAPALDPSGQLGVMTGSDLLERFRQAGLEASGQRRSVTVLFVDLSGYTQLSESWAMKRCTNWYNSSSACWSPTSTSMRAWSIS